MYKKFYLSVVVACAIAHNVAAMQHLGPSNDKVGNCQPALKDEEFQAYLAWLEFTQAMKKCEQEKAAAAAAHKLAVDKQPVSKL